MMFVAFYHIDNKAKKALWCVVWDLSEVEAWLEARRKAPIAQADPPDVRRRRRHPVKDGGWGASSVA